jgi:hypothetical protein
VAFIVNVRVVENKVNSHVGRVMVVNVISQTRVPGMMLNKKSMNLPSVPHTFFFALSLPIPAEIVCSAAEVAYWATELG